MVALHRQDELVGIMVFQGESQERHFTTVVAQVQLDGDVVAELAVTGQADGDDVLDASQCDGHTAAQVGHVAQAELARDKESGLDDRLADVEREDACTVTGQF